MNKWSTILSFSNFSKTNVAIPPDDEVFLYSFENPAYVFSNLPILKSFCLDDGNNASAKTSSSFTSFSGLGLNGQSLIAFSLNESSKIGTKKPSSFQFILDELDADVHIPQPTHRSLLTISLIVYFIVLFYL